MNMRPRIWKLSTRNSCSQFWAIFVNLQCTRFVSGFFFALYFLFQTLFSILFSNYFRLTDFFFVCVTFSLFCSLNMFTIWDVGLQHTNAQPNILLIFYIQEKYTKFWFIYINLILLKPDVAKKSQWKNLLIVLYVYLSSNYKKWVERIIFRWLKCVRCVVLNEILWNRNLVTHVVVLGSGIRYCEDINDPELHFNVH